MSVATRRRSCTVRRACSCRRAIPRRWPRRCWRSCSGRIAPRRWARRAGAWPGIGSSDRAWCRGTKRSTTSCSLVASVSPMCGISGRVNYRTGAPVSAETLETMCDLIRHRGPDGSGVWTDGAVGFGHRRLAVIDPSDAGRQPFQSVDGRLSITFNGEIYNFQEARRALEQDGCRFLSLTDTEVVVHAYRRYGVACLEHLRGMFAFSIWDADQQRLFAARDRAGEKPFYYREDADGLAFASEPKAFLAEPSFVPE